MDKPTKPKAKTDWKLILQLFLSTFKLGALTFGGGYAIVPLMQGEMVEKKHWINNDEMLDIVALSQAVPGAIAINASVFVGYRIQGVIGSVAAVLGTALPSLITLAVISYFYAAFKENKWVNAALSGVRAGVVALMIQAVLKLGKPALKDWFTWLLAIAAFVLAVFFSVNVALLILGGGALGAAFYFYKRKGGKADA